MSKLTRALVFIVCYVIFLSLFYIVGISLLRQGVSRNLIIISGIILGTLIGLFLGQFFKSRVKK